VRFPDLSILRALARTRIIAAALSIFFLTTTLPAAGQRPTLTPAELTRLGLQEHSLLVGSTERWFLVQPPPDPARDVPVLLVLHGGGQSMRRLFTLDAGATRAWPELARRENALLLVPNGTNPETGDTRGDSQNWNDLREDVSRESTADDVAFILAVLEWAHKNHCTDKTRVYVSGASNGGMMTFRLLIEAPDTFAAAASFVASLPVESSRLKKPPRPTPLMLVHGTRDPLVQWQGGKIPGGRGHMRSVADTVTWWIEANRATRSTQAPATLPDRDPKDGCTIERQEYPATDGGASVTTYTVRGGGHNLPSLKYPLPDSRLVRRFIGPACRDLEGTDLAWEFLSRHRR
jgi:polyhydroxybutyrate depolymerase